MGERASHGGRRGGGGGGGRTAPAVRRTRVLQYASHVHGDGRGAFALDCPRARERVLDSFLRLQHAPCTVACTSAM